MNEEPVGKLMGESMYPNQASLPWHGPSADRVEVVATELRQNGYDIRTIIRQVDARLGIVSSYNVEILKAAYEFAALSFQMWINGERYEFTGDFGVEDALSRPETAEMNFWVVVVDMCKNRFGPGTLTRLDNKRATWRTE